MANPQPDKFIRISTELFEALIRTPLPGRTRQVFDAILRKTYGFNKTRDEISLSQLQKMTCMTRNRVCEALNQLIAMNMVVRKSGLGKPSSYSIQKNYEDWKLVRKNGHVRKNGRPEKRTQVVRKNGHTIDTLTIDNNIITDLSAGDSKSKEKSELQIRKESVYPDILRYLKNLPYIPNDKSEHYKIAQWLIKRCLNRPEVVPHLLHRVANNLIQLKSLRAFYKYMRKVSQNPQTMGEVESASYKTL